MKSVPILVLAELARCSGSIRDAGNCLRKSLVRRLETRNLVYCQEGSEPLRDAGTTWSYVESEVIGLRLNRVLHKFRLART